MSNETTKKLSDLKPGDSAVIRYSGRWGKNESLTPTIVTKVLPSGKIKTRTPGITGERTWFSGGDEYGHKYGSESLRPLADGETAETIAADKKVAEAEKNRAEAAADAEHDVAVAEWWKAEGEALWNAAIEIPGGFMDEKVFIIRYTRYQEQYMPFIVIKNGKDWMGKDEIEAAVGGLTGRKYKEDKKASINTYSNSNLRGKTIQDVLYAIVR